MDEIRSRCRFPLNAADKSQRARAIASLCQEIIEHIVPNASGFEVELPASKDLWDSIATRVALVSSGTALMVVFKDYD